MTFWSLSSSLVMIEERRPSMWWRVSTTMHLAHTPEPDTIAPLPVRWQRRAKGLEVDTLVGGTPFYMYRHQWCQVLSF
jgi:hypothetical protein